ncbi:hypothetical protein LINPERHAP2_LOCUS18645, partial [Linum perenne]
MKRYFSRIEKATSTNVEEIESDGSKQEKATFAAVKETESDGSKQASTFPPMNAQSSSLNQSREGPPTSVERSFSSMKYIKNELRNRMNDEWLNDSMVTYIEQDLCASLDK